MLRHVAQRFYHKVNCRPVWTLVLNYSPLNLLNSFVEPVLVELLIRLHISYFYLFNSEFSVISGALFTYELYLDY